MQDSKERQHDAKIPRLAWRTLLFAGVLACVFLLAGYAITDKAETKAKNDFLKSRQSLVAARLDGLRVEHYRSSENSYAPSEALLADLRQLLAQGQLAYVIILDKNGVSVADAGSGLRDAVLEALGGGAPQADTPAGRLVVLGGEGYLHFSLLLPRTDSLRVLYGISLHSLAEVGYGLSGMLNALLWTGVAALLLLGLFCVFYLVLPLRKLLRFAEGRADGGEGNGAGAPPEAQRPEARRNDELGRLWRSFLALLGAKAAAEAAPRLTAAELLRTGMDILEPLRHGFLVATPDGSIICCNGAARKIFGHAQILPQANLTPLMEGIMTPDEFREFRRRFDLLPQAEEAPLEFAREDGEENGMPGYAVSLSRRSVLGEDCIACIIYDIRSERRLNHEESLASARLEKSIQERTEELVKVNEQLRQENAERRAIEQALVRAESRYREIVNNSIEGIFQRTSDGRLLSANASMARILGYASVEELLDAYQKPGTRICYTNEMEFAITELLDIRGWVSNLEFQALMQDGSPVWVAMNARRVADSGGETLYYEAFIEDITSRKKTEEKLVYQAFHDPLTGLPNRALFLDRLRMALRRSKRHGEYLFAVLYLDLDRFKNINDSFGHSAGDKMLNHATDKLLQCVREADTVARFGGDEFAVLLADLEKPSQAVLIAKRISAALDESVNFHGQDVSIGASIGIVLSSPEYNTPEDILRDADTAMYKSKMQGRRGYTVFNERMREETVAALALESDLRGAVERKEIEAFYQPLIDLETGQVSGFEALMRWRRGPDVVSPVMFIPIAEETGLIYDLGLEMMRLVCRQIVDWTMLMGHCDFVVHVNISGKQLMAAHFWRDVQEILIETGVNPRQVILEITESVFLDYGSKIISVMNLVRDFGVRFCLDDFGTGFSSLSYLRLLPLESLKVDRSFIVDINTDNYSEAILRNLVTMGSDLGLKVITEGVDQGYQVDALRAVGCRFAQGFYFSEPLPGPEAAEYMKLHGCPVRS